jgi:hypothetical protein
MKHDLNKSKSYEHMMGKEKKAHEGSQSKAPTKMDGGATTGGHMMGGDADNDGM